MSERSSSFPVAIEPNSTASLTFGSVRSAALDEIRGER
jgi:hypothetical protein